MKANELRIGDWVSVDGEPYQMDEIPCGTPIMLYDDKTHKFKDYMAEDLKPIILTEEILRGNGWSADEDYDNEWVYPIGNCNRLCIAPKRKADKDKCVYIVYLMDFLGRISSLRSIRYVHELQHLLWALGNEKEINL